ncbi:uncharacterized protein BDR25DRAFT_267824 [Lindgomyces ingoldianus]|uniref:Uncharacterized protein n=1 Tax=Lindgomyces ingoldianus TaxID=673940 RepID=A0ACB6QKI8_9PLEO|nr:uncharacterized protein BDR25DRAFT_267824 [Lindgomyces ingoldianus]KAF2467035.1 hypothetical protein BDR25DRAFT_267824 [Lindgomyces ingoldianus]
MLLPKRFVEIVLLLLVFLAVTISISRHHHLTLLFDAFYTEPKVTPYVNHVVLFQFKQSTSITAIKEVTSKMLALKKTCIHPSTRQAYIKSISGGKDMSIEKQQNGMTHAFVVQFLTLEDRDYYVNEDPVHRAFKDAASSVLEEAQVVDFIDGVFA